MTVVEFEISVRADNGVVFVGVRVPGSANRDDIEIVMIRIAGAFASVERLDEQQMMGLLFNDRTRSQSKTASGFVLRREYSDPEYPIKLDHALKQLSRANKNLH